MWSFLSALTVFSSKPWLPVLYINQCGNCIRAVLCLEKVATVLAIVDTVATVISFYSIFVCRVTLTFFWGGGGIKVLGHMVLIFPFIVAVFVCLINLKHKNRRPLV